MLFRRNHIASTKTKKARTSSVKITIYEASKIDSLGKYFLHGPYATKVVLLLS